MCTCTCSILLDSQLRVNDILHCRPLYDAINIPMHDDRNIQFSTPACTVDHIPLSLCVSTCRLCRAVSLEIKTSDIIAFFGAPYYPEHWSNLSCLCAFWLHSTVHTTLGEKRGCKKPGNERQIGCTTIRFDWSMAVISRLARLAGELTNCQRKATPINISLVVFVSCSMYMCSIHDKPMFNTINCMQEELQIPKGKDRVYNEQECFVYCMLTKGDKYMY